MEKSLILENRKQWIAMAGAFILNGIILLFGDDLETVRLIVGGAMIILSILYLLFSFVGYSIHSRYAARIRITDNLIELKTSFWKPLIQLKWREIREISFGNFKVEFRLLSETKSIIYDTTDEHSIQLKQMIKESAEQRNIQVIGG